MTQPRDVIPGVPAAGHVGRGGYWHPGAQTSCVKCKQDDRFRKQLRARKWHEIKPPKA